MGQLDGKVAIVTGSGRGIGQQVALRLARDGAAVVVNDLDDAPARETIALIERAGGRAVACNGDVTAKDFGDRIVDTAVRQLGGLHVIVNNAGYTWDNVIQKTTDEQFQAMLDIHLVTPFRILRAASTYLRETASDSLVKLELAREHEQRGERATGDALVLNEVLCNLEDPVRARRTSA